jgi:undecaprenyl pyrophosphate phosphatase UppP
MTKMLKTLKMSKFTFWLTVGAGAGASNIMFNDNTPFLSYSYIALLIIAVVTTVIQGEVKADEYTQALYLEGMRWAVVWLLLAATVGMIATQNNSTMLAAFQGIFFGSTLVYLLAGFYARWKLRK